MRVLDRTPIAVAVNLLQAGGLYADGQEDPPSRSLAPPPTLDGSRHIELSIVLLCDLPPRLPVLVTMGASRDPGEDGAKDDVPSFSGRVHNGSRKNPLHLLPPEEARVRAVAEIINTLIKRVKEGKDVNLNQLRMEVGSRDGLGVPGSVHASSSARCMGNDAAMPDVVAHTPARRWRPSTG